MHDVAGYQKYWNICMGTLQRHQLVITLGFSPSRFLMIVKDAGSASNPWVVINRF